MTKAQRTEVKKQALSDSLSGAGLFIFKNKTNASLQLPKKSFDGKKWIEPNQTWKGDSFFFKMVPREALLVKTLISPDQQLEQKKEAKMEEKLLLDQPDQVTPDGQVEHVVCSDNVTLTENTKKKKSKSDKKLLTEDPVAGVTIIRD